MAKTPDQINELNQKATETAAKLAQLSMEQGEHMIKLQVDAMRSMLDDNMKAVKALMEVRDPQQWGAVQERNMRDMMGRLTDYTRSMQNLAGKTQKEISDVVEDRLHAMNAQCQSLVDSMAEAAPPGSEPVFSAMKQTLSAADGLMDTMSKTAQQFAQTAESAMKVAADAAVKPGKGGKGGKSGKSDD